MSRDSPEARPGEWRSGELCISILPESESWSSGSSSSRRTLPLGSSSSSEGVVESAASLSRRCSTCRLFSMRSSSSLFSSEDCLSAATSPAVRHEYRAIALPLSKGSPAPSVAAPLGLLPARGDSLLLLLLIKKCKISGGVAASKVVAKVASSLRGPQSSVISTSCGCGRVLLTLRDSLRAGEAPAELPPTLSLLLRLKPPLSGPSGSCLSPREPASIEAKRRAAPGLFSRVTTGWKTSAAALGPPRLMERRRSPSKLLRVVWKAARAPSCRLGRAKSKLALPYL
ncbi:hypothetical protein E2C01_043412 [Portunus trituberculatus]|uniref:Uncharacterized protein n=1 Tax=Portunus trituberculatus TaxID=210409 RepID=A0A5B7FWB8_PORTR|nr:hypothetical protein [Portunus trituberculatus]